MADERVVGGNAVRRVSVGVRIDAQDLRERRRAILAVVVRVVLGAAVAEADVEHAVGADRHLAAVVVGVRLRREEHAAPAGRVGAGPADRVLVDVGVSLRVGVAHEEMLAVGGEHRAEQALLVPVAEIGAQVERGGGGRSAVHDLAERSRLLGHVHGAGGSLRAGPERDHDRAREPGDDGPEREVHAVVRSGVVVVVVAAVDDDVVAFVVVVVVETGEIGAVDGVG